LETVGCRLQRFREVETPIDQPASFETPQPVLVAAFLVLILDPFAILAVPPLAHQRTGFDPGLHFVEP
jgi:hypothetical protein